MSKPGIILQARLNSSRLPNKVLCKINGKCLIDIVLEECERTNLPVVIAIPRRDNKVLGHHLLFKDVFYGAEEDVISRFYYCAKKYQFDPVIRVCADAKMVHSDLILQQLENYKKYKHIMSGNLVDVFSFKQLEWHYKYDKRPQTREHVTQGMFQDLTVDYEIDLN